jgi:hypothetical protein
MRRVRVRQVRKGARPPASRRFGPALHAQGPAWVGKLVLRYWPDQGGWWEAKVGEYSATRNKHKLIYDADTENVRHRPCSPHLSPQHSDTSAQMTSEMLAPCLIIR